MKREEDHTWNTSFSLFGFVTPHPQLRQQTTTYVADWGQSASKVSLRCRDWYVSVGVSSISPTFPRVPFHFNILSDASLTSPSPAVLVRRYSGTLVLQSVGFLGLLHISELSICPYLIIVHSTTSWSRRPSLPRAFRGLRRSHHCSSLGLLIPD